MLRVLVADDDEELAEFVRFALERPGIEVDVVHTSDQAYRRASTEAYDVILLDVEFPEGIDGYEVLAKLRAKGFATPVIMMTGRRDSADVVHGLHTGADDYVPKPFDVGVLEARIGAVLRRSRPAGALAVGEFDLDDGERVARFRGKPVRLTGREAALLKALLLHAGETVASEDLLLRVWGLGDTTDTGVLRAHIAHLRAKLSRIGADSAVRTTRGRGFMFDPESLG